MDLDLDLHSAAPNNSGENLEQADGSGFQWLPVVELMVMVI